MNSQDNQNNINIKPDKPSRIKYIKPSRYSSEMFVPLFINDYDRQLISIKKYNNGKEYIFLKSHRITGEPLVSGRIYQLDISRWRHRGYNMIRYKLSETLEQSKLTKYYKPAKCLIK